MLMPIFLIKMVATLVGRAITNKISGHKPTAREAAELETKPTKGLIQSKTAQGSTVALGMFLFQSGWPGSPAEWGAWAAAIVAWAVTLWGRIKAKKAIG